MTQTTREISYKDDNLPRVSVTKTSNQVQPGKARWPIHMTNGCSWPKSVVITNSNVFTIRTLTQLRSQGEETCNDSSDYWHRWTPHSDWTLTMTLDLLVPHYCSRTHCNSKDMIYQAMRKQTWGKKMINNNFNMQLNVQNKGVPNVLIILKVMKHRPDCPDLLLNHLYCLSAVASLLHIEDDCILFWMDSLCYCTARTSNCPLASLVLSMRGWVWN